MNKHIICKIKCKASDHDIVSKILKKYINPAREEGCLYYDLYADSNDLGIFYIIDGWLDDEAVAKHVKNPNVIRVNKLLEPYLLEKQQLTWLNKLEE